MRYFLTLARAVVLTGVAVFGLLSCGGGGGSSSPTATTINGIAVPPEPDVVVNNATIAGMDSNNNGVRDDVERYLAKNSTDVSAFKNSLDDVKEIQYLLTNENLTPEQLEQVMTKRHCLSYKAMINKIKRTDDMAYLNQVLNNQSRKDAYKNNVKTTPGLAFGEDTECAQ